jgi:hypothetical protein
MVLNTAPNLQERQARLGLVTVDDDLVVSSDGRTSRRTPCTLTRTPRSENLRMGVTRSIPLIMHADNAASSSAG